MNSVLIIGASGYIGSRLCFLLAKKGKKITALCYPSAPKDKEWCSLMEKIIIGDITSSEIIEKITNQSYDSVIHLVSLNHDDSKKSPSYVNSINVIPVWELLDNFNNKQTIKKFIYFSTVQVYGKINSTTINEDSKTSPLNQYALTHLMAENINNFYHQSSNIDCINIRLSNSFGSPMFSDIDCWWLVINELCKEAFLNQKIILKSDGSPLRDFIHYLDLVGALECIIDNRINKTEDNIYNISSEKTLSILDIAKKVKNVYERRFNKKINIEFKNKNNKIAINSLVKYKISNKRIQKLGFSLKVNIYDGINELFDYLDSKNNEK
mgnify:CR=1 FL=1